MKSFEFIIKEFIQAVNLKNLSVCTIKKSHPSHIFLF